MSLLLSGSSNASSNGYSSMNMLSIESPIFSWININHYLNPNKYIKMQLKKNTNLFLKYNTVFNM